jgi:hypothetical protein
MWAKDKYTGFSQPLQDIHDDSGFLGTPHLFHSRFVSAELGATLIAVLPGREESFLKVNQ